MYLDMLLIEEYHIRTGDTKCISRERVEKMETMGDRIKALREARGMTTADVARSLGILKPNYRKYENGERHPKREQVERLAKLFGCLPMDILESRIDQLTDNLNNAMVNLVVSGFSVYEVLLFTWNNYERCGEIEAFFLDYATEHDIEVSWNNARVAQLKELFLLSNKIEAMNGEEKVEQRIKFMAIFIDYYYHRKDYDTVQKEVGEALGEPSDLEACIKFAGRIALPAFSILRDMAVCSDGTDEPDMQKAFALSRI